ncbi:PadR family transcriptional regulator [Undibacterium sp.]|jgi:DNA-binding PadR family transcriptional regulator|uniref:PadR family transcriptional regulator n=1 Tax=Undibacterium sp. TaxID=1914977 RepID=UPI002CF12681|nr:PadR family transcriptional regulator [Undibacterium sp.]HTD03597.1 PadR family transcriptional regulator [Undibacterium sp.]
MSLPHALLTSLLEQPCSGFELARRFDRSIGFFWHATHQQIYRELGRLEESGWLESLPPESGRGRKKVYRVLPAGREELQRWTGESQDPRPLRDELMLRLRAEAVIGPTALAEDIQRRLQMHKAKLALYRQLEAHDFPPQENSRAARLQHLVLSAGIMHEALWVEWSEQALQVLASDS